MVIGAQPQEVLWMIVLATGNRIEVRCLAGLHMVIANSTSPVCLSLDLLTNARRNWRTLPIFVGPRHSEPSVECLQLSLIEEHEFAFFFRDLEFARVALFGREF